MNATKIVIAVFSPNTPPDPKPSVKANIPSNAAFVNQPFVIGWQLDQIKKGMPVRIKFAKDSGVYKLIKATKANAAGIGAINWRPKAGQRTENGLILVCAVPSRGIAEVCSEPTSVTVQ
jgi:hypothetical protein